MTTYLEHGPRLDIDSDIVNAPTHQLDEMLARRTLGMLRDNDAFLRDAACCFFKDEIRLLHAEMIGLHSSGVSAWRHSSLGVAASLYLPQQRESYFMEAFSLAASRYGLDHALVLAQDTDFMFGPDGGGNELGAHAAQDDYISSARKRLERRRGGGEVEGYEDTFLDREMNPTLTAAEWSAYVLERSRDNYTGNYTHETDQLQGYLGESALDLTSLVEQDGRSTPAGAVLIDYLDLYVRVNEGMVILSEDSDDKLVSWGPLEFLAKKERLRLNIEAKEEDILDLVDDFCEWFEQDRGGFMDVASKWGNARSSTECVAEDGYGYSGGLIHLVEYLSSPDKFRRVGYMEDLGYSLSVEGLIKMTNHYHGLLFAEPEPDSRYGDERVGIKKGFKNWAIFEDGRGNKRFYGLTHQGVFVVGIQGADYLPDDYRLGTILPDQMFKDPFKYYKGTLVSCAEGEDKGKMHKLDHDSRIVAGDIRSIHIADGTASKRGVASAERDPRKAYRLMFNDY